MRIKYRPFSYNEPFFTSQFQYKSEWCRKPLEFSKEVWESFSAESKSLINSLRNYCFRLQYNSDCKDYNVRLENVSFKDSKLILEFYFSNDKETSSLMLVLPKSQVKNLLERRSIRFNTPIKINEDLRLKDFHLQIS